MGPRSATAPAKSRRLTDIDDDFREAAVRQVVVAGRSVSVVARDLGLGASTLYRWVAHLRDRVAGETDVEAIRRENHELKAAIAFLEDENEILRRAALAYARHQAPPPSTAYSSGGHANS